MKCDDAMKWTAGRALDDLEDGDRRGLEEHLAACAACRSAAELDARTVAALRSTGSDEGSEVRRERTVAAMSAAYRELDLSTSTRIPRRRWMAAAVAAAVLAAVALPMLYTRGGLSVERLDGTAWIKRAGSKDRVPARLGDVVRAGDLLTTESVVGLKGAGKLKVMVNAGSEISYDDAGRTPILRLSQGAVYVDVPEKEITIVDPSERRATVRDGKFEVRIPIVASPAGEKKTELLVQVEKGVALVAGSGGALEVTIGKAASVDQSGRIHDQKPGLVAPWRKQP